MKNSRAASFNFDTALFIFNAESEFIITEKTAVSEGIAAVPTF